MTALVALDGVSKRFGRNTVLQDVSLQVAPGSIHAVVGDVVPFEELPAAMTAMADRRTTGRVVVRV